MMAKEKLQIVLDADWRGKSEIQGANRDIEKLDANVSKTGGGFAKFAKAGAVAFAAVAGAVAAVGVAAKVAWDELGRGAALVQSREQFENLAKSIHTTADVMLGKLKDATNGMVSDAKLIAGAGQIISLGLADTEDGVVRLATLVAKLGWDMQQVIMTFANNSVMRLDSLGLSVEDVNNKMKDLVDIGYSADKAFDMAVIEAGEEKLDLLGDTADTTAGDIKRLQAAWEEARDAFSIGFAEGAAEDVKLLAGDVNIAIESIERAGGAWGRFLGWLAIQQFGATIAFDELDRAVKAGVISQEEHETATIRLAGRLDTAAETLEFVAEKTKDWTDDIDDSVSGLGDQIAAASSADIMLRRYGLGADIAAAATDNLVSALGGLTFRASRDLPNILSLTQAQWDAGAQERESDTIRIGPGAAVTLEQEMGLIASASGRAKDALEDAEDATDPLSGGLYNVSSAAETAADKMARLAAETGKFFDQARRSEDFDPAEAFYSAALAAGASAAQLQQLLVGTGLETPERAQEIYDESIQRQLAQQAGQAFAGGGNLDMLWQGIQAGMANPAWAQQVTQNVSNQTDVGGISLEFNIYGNITGEDLDMVVDNAISEAVEQQGGG